MIHLPILVVWLCYFNSNNAFNAFYQTSGNEYHQMNYIPIGSTLVQFSIKSKLLCAAQCARLFPTCNIAVFDSSVTSQCSLYSERLTTANLIPFANAIVIDFRRSLAVEETSTQQSVPSELTTQEHYFIANTYGSLDSNSADAMRNNYIIANVDEPAILAGFVSNVSMKFCSLPTSTSPVLWIYIVRFAGPPSYYQALFMYAVPANEINTIDTIQQYTLPHYWLNISVGEFVGVGFGQTTGGSPCQVASGNATYTNAYGGANQTYLVSFQASYAYNLQFYGVSISYTVLTLV